MTTIDTLKYHQPGLRIASAGSFEIIIWAPGPVTHDGHPSGTERDQWQVGVDTTWVDRGDDEGYWADGGFGHFDTFADAVNYIKTFDLLDQGDLAVLEGWGPDEPEAAS